jgi:hypothetical protein
MHGIVPLFDASVILLQTIVEVLVRPMLDMIAHCLAYSSWIGTIPICRDRLWGMPNPSLRLLEKPLSCLHVPFLTQHGVNEMAIVIDRTIQIAPFSVDFDVRLIHVPGFPRLPPSFHPQLARYKWSKSRFPFSNCFMSTHEAPLQKHFGQIPQAQLVPQLPQNNQEHHIGGIFQEIEWCSCPLVEKVLASGATECAIAERGLLSLLFGGG